MLKKNDTLKNELPEEPTPIIEETDTEDEFDGPINVLALENDDFDDWNPELEKFRHLSKLQTAVIPAMPSILPLDKKITTKVVIPAKFICPLSKQIMTEPVRIAGSKVPIAYEKSAIESYYDEHGKDPMTHEDLDDDAHFIPDLALTREITDFCLTHVTA